MKDGLLTDRQREIHRYRKQGMTQQQIADIIKTSKANVCTIEKSAMENIGGQKRRSNFCIPLMQRISAPFLQGQTCSKSRA